MVTIILLLNIIIDLNQEVRLLLDHLHHLWQESHQMVQGGSLLDSFILHLIFITYVIVNIMHRTVKSIRLNRALEGVVGCV